MTEFVHEFYINEEEGAKRIMNTTRRYAELLSKLKADTSLSDLQAFIAAKDWKKAQAAAHALKGIAVNLSLSELANEAQAAEARVKEQALTDEHLAQLKACFDATVLEAEKALSSTM